MESMRACLCVVLFLCSTSGCQSSRRLADWLPGNIRSQPVDQPVRVGDPQPDITLVGQTSGENDGGEQFSEDETPTFWQMSQLEAEPQEDGSYEDQPARNSVADDDVPLSIDLATARRVALRHNKSIVVQSYLPDEAAEGVDEQIGYFDPVLGFETVGGKLDQQVANIIQSFGVASETQQQDFLHPGSTNQLFLRKQLETGGIAEIGTSTDYRALDPASGFVLVNPAWRSALNFSIEQPLFKGFGPDIANAPIRIAKADRAQSIHTFRALVLEVLRDVEFAYWDTVSARKELNIREKILKQAELTWQRQKERLKLGDGTIPDVAQAEEQYMSFQIQAVQARNRFAAAQLYLHKQLGYEADDNTRLIPVSEPTAELVDMDWYAAISLVASRPEILAQHAAIRVASTLLKLERNGLKPDVSITGRYAITGLDNRYDQSVTTVFDNQFADWSAGVFYNVPLGQRAQHAAVHRASYVLSREKARLDELEHQLLHDLRDARRNLTTDQEVLQMHQRRRKAAERHLEARSALYEEKADVLFETVINAESRRATAVLDENAAGIEYQKSLVQWRYVNGTLLGDDLILDE